MKSIRELESPRVIPLHPKLRFWEEMMSRPDISGAFVEIFPTSIDLLDNDIKLYVNFTNEKGWPCHQDETEWSTALHEGLAALRVRGKTQEDEVMRFALGLRDRLMRAAEAGGNTFFKSALFAWVGELDEAQESPLKEQLAAIRGVSRPYKEGGTYERMVVAFKKCIKSHYDMLHQELAYPPEEANALLLQALALVLDMLFYITYSRQMGL